MEVLPSPRSVFYAQGGTVLYGSDLGAVDYDPTDEYFLMSAAGLSFREILASLTTTPAAEFGESHRLGRIAPGIIADLIALRSDCSLCLIKDRGFQ
jgi:imidazolonepropionase-like amidohydrolase